MTALSGLAGGDDAHDGGELGTWSPDKVAEEPTALSLPCLPPGHVNDDNFTIGSSIVSSPKAWLVVFSSSMSDKCSSRCSIIF